MCGGAGTPGSGRLRARAGLSCFCRCLDRIRRFRKPFAGFPFRLYSAVLSSSPTINTAFLVAEQLAAIGIEADIMLEPMRRDSGLAIAAGAVFAGQARR